jgi:hypothetical protein
MLGVRAIGEHRVHQPLARGGRILLEDRLQPLVAGRQAAQDEAGATQPGRTVAIARGRQPRARQRVLDEAVGLAPRPAVGRGRDGLFQLAPRPVALVDGARLDPAPQHLDFPARQGLVPVDGRHAFVGVRAEDALQDGAARGIAWRHGGIEAFLRAHRVLATIETQPGLARVRIGAVAGEALGCEDRRHVARPGRRATSLGHGSAFELRGRGEEDGGEERADPHGARIPRTNGSGHGRIGRDSARRRRNATGRPSRERPAVRHPRGQPSSAPDGATRRRSGAQGTHTASRPFVRLKVLGVQNAAALRYHTW